MAIMLHTGAPGSGKTLFAVKKLYDVWAKSGRDIYIKDLDGDFLDVPHTRIYPNDEFDWRKLPDGSVVIIDEAHKTWPVLGRGMSPTQDVVDLREHRHRGFDFLLITQHPFMLAKEITPLVTDHFHFVRSRWRKASRVYESSEFTLHQSSLMDRENSVKPWDKKVFAKYVSASLHEGKRSMFTPTVVKALGACCVLVGCFGSLFFYFGNQRFLPEDMRRGAGDDPISQDHPLLQDNPGLEEVRDLVDQSVASTGGVGQVEIEKFALMQEIGTCDTVTDLNFQASNCVDGITCISGRCTLAGLRGLATFDYKLQFELILHIREYGLPRSAIRSRQSYPPAAPTPRSRGGRGEGVFPGVLTGGLQN